MKGRINGHQPASLSAVPPVSRRDPDEMTPRERLAELGRIFAIGYLRSRARANDLAPSRADAALCDHAVDGAGAVPAKEVA